MEYYRLPLYIIFGVLPSIIWLLYYLKKDLHPEPKRMIIKIFLYGSLVTILVLFIQIGLVQLLKLLNSFPFFIHYPIVIEILKWFAVIAFTEEIFKYLVVRLGVFHNKALDEPLDVMLYMVVAALGFAAVENILYLIPLVERISFNITLQTTVTVSFLRFIGATFLHTLCSATLGYFTARSFFKTRNRVQLTTIGIFIAVSLHGLYNFSIIKLDTPLNFVIPATIIIVLSIFVIFGFNDVKKMKSVTKI